MNATWHGGKTEFENADTVATDRFWSINSVVKGRAEGTRLAKVVIRKKPNTPCQMYRITGTKVT
jgi:hypothetical protein